MDTIKVFYIIFSIIIIIFTILLIIVYSKDKYFHGYKNRTIDEMKLYPCYFNIFFCIIVGLNNLARLIPETITVDPSIEVNEANIMCQAQAFLVSLFDKLLVSLMTIYSIINYLSVFKSDFYRKYLKKIYIILILIGFCFSLILTIIYFLGGISFKDVLCYIHTRTSLKIISDSIYTGILFIINLFCLISIIINLFKLNKKYSQDGNDTQFQKSSNFLKRFTLDLIINIIAFTYTLILINKVFPKGSHKDLIYILICLIVELFFTVNQSLFQAFIRLITCNKYYKVEEENEDEDGQDIHNDLDADFCEEN